MWRSGRARWTVGWCVAAVLSLAMVACGQAPTDPSRSLHGGTYVSATYHFRVTYPDGWAVSENGCSSGSAAPADCNELGATATPGSGTLATLQVTVTRAGQSSVGAPGGSVVTITVADLRDPNVATAAAALDTNPSLHKTTLAGQPAYTTAAVQQSLPGANGTPSAVTDTHTDYFLVHDGFEYQISVDAISGDNATAALQGILQSFAFTG
jgi:hypothetical protein